MKNKDILKKSKLSKQKFKEEIDSSTGLSYNGTTHTTPTRTTGGDFYLERYFLDSGEGLSQERKNAMVTHKDLILKMIPESEHKKALKQIKIWEQELNDNSKAK